MYRLPVAIILSISSFAASAADVAVPPTALPEPNGLALLGIGAVAGLAIWLRNRNKK